MQALQIRLSFCNLPGDFKSLYLLTVKKIPTGTKSTTAFRGRCTSVSNKTEIYLGKIGRHLMNIVGRELHMRDIKWLRLLENSRSSMDI